MRSPKISDDQFAMRSNLNWIVRMLPFAWLILITILGVITSFKGIVPLDARTGLQIANNNLAFDVPIVGSVLEPFTSVAQIIYGAPDYRIAASSIAFWLFLISALIAFWKMGLREKCPTFQIRALKSLLSASAIILMLIVYGCFMVLVPIPSRSLVARDPTIIVADLHSHTTWSPDAIASSSQNLAYHQARGYGVVAFTEHLTKIWQSTGFVIPNQSETQPLEVIRGVEFGIQNFGEEKIFLLALGVKPDARLPYVDPNNPFNSKRKFPEEALRQLIDFVHNIEHGVVVAVGFRLHAKDIERLAALGVDGFELANFGHPENTEDVKNTMLKVQNSYHLALLADSDWHGWSGFARTWNLFDATDSIATRSDQVINALRNHDSQRVVPVVSHMMGTPSDLRRIFAPLVEIIRYAGELSRLQLVSWWIWTIIFLWIAKLLKRAGIPAAQCFVGCTLLVLGGGLLFRGLGLIAMWYRGAPFTFPRDVGIGGSAIGIITLLVAGLIIRHCVQSRAAGCSPTRTA